MDKIQKFEVAVGIFISALFVALGYELKDLRVIPDTTIMSVTIFMVSYILSSIAVGFFTNWIVKLKFIRRLLFIDHWIEGYWYNIDYEAQSEVSVFNATAITEIKFKNTLLGFETVGFRIAEEREIYTFSQYVILIGPNNLYMNFCTSSARGAFRNLIAAGYFYKAPGSEFINIYDGVVVEVDGTSSFRQRAKKMSSTEVMEIKKRYGKDWVRQFLVDSTSSNTNQNISELRETLTDPD